VRDTDGRTYAAATVSLPSLRLSALQPPWPPRYPAARPAWRRRRWSHRRREPGAESVAAVPTWPDAPLLVADATGAVRAVLTP